MLLGTVCIPQARMQNLTVLSVIAGSRLIVVEQIFAVGLTVATLIGEFLAHGRPRHMHDPAVVRTSESWTKADDSRKRTASYYGIGMHRKFN